MVAHAFARMRNITPVLVLRRATFSPASPRMCGEHVTDLHATTHPHWISHTKKQLSACCIPPRSGKRKIPLKLNFPRNVSALRHFITTPQLFETLKVSTVAAWLVKRGLIQKGNKLSKRKRNAPLKRKITLITKISPQLGVHNAPFNRQCGPTSRKWNTRN